jgi:hypothetical protein
VFYALASHLLADDDPPADPPVKAPLKKGFCSKCGKHIGRGLFLHTKKCTGQK